MEFGKGQLAKKVVSKLLTRIRSGGVVFRHPANECQTRWYNVKGPEKVQQTRRLTRNLTYMVTQIVISFFPVAQVHSLSSEGEALVNR